MQRKKKKEGKRYRRPKKGKTNERTNERDGAAGRNPDGEEKENGVVVVGECAMAGKEVAGPGVARVWWWWWWWYSGHGANGKPPLTHNRGLQTKRNATERDEEAATWASPSSSDDQFPFGRKISVTNLSRPPLLGDRLHESSSFGNPS